MVSMGMGYGASGSGWGPVERGAERFSAARIVHGLARVHGHMAHRYNPFAGSKPDFVPDPILPPASGPSTMSVARVTEISASSEKSFKDAIEKGVKRACKTLQNVEGAWVQEQKVVIKGGEVKEYRVSMKVTFVLKD